MLLGQMAMQKWWILGLCDNREKSIIVKSHYRYRENFIIILL